GSVYAYDTTDVNQLFSYYTTYLKASLILHQLRWMAGDTAFFRGVNDYLQNPQHRYGFSRTEDLKDHIAAYTSIDMDKYIDDWVYRDGYPHYQLHWEQKGKNFIITGTQDPLGHSDSL